MYNIVLTIISDVLLQNHRELLVTKDNCVLSHTMLIIRDCYHQSIPRN